jgi:surface carbohydrate biosynthesis protein
MHILLPSETQVREFDPKLLLACAVAERGIPCVIGSRIQMHSVIDRLPRGIYLAKDVRHSSARILGIIERLGYRIAALDEEGLVTLPPVGYWAQRVTPDVLERVELFLAWGEEHVSAISHAPGNRADVVPTGNPRFDLLRPELRAFYQSEADALRRRYGRFVLINSNFGRSNPAVKPQAPLAAPASEGELMIESYFRFRDLLFPAFADAVPRLAAAVPDIKVILRPHPAENFDHWRARCRGVPNIEVVHEGYIAPWLLAAETVVHNGCTTGIEAAILDRSCISYRPIRADGIEIALPTDVSHDVHTFEALLGAVRAAIGGHPGGAMPTHRDVMSRHVSALDGELASDRMAAALAAAAARRARKAPLRARLQAHGQATVRRWEKSVKSLIPGHKNSRTYTRQRFPGVSLDEARDKMARFRSILGRFDRVSIRPLGPHLYEVYPAAA